MTSGDDDLGAAPSQRRHSGDELVLASTSPYRRMLLERLGAPFRCRAPQCDEDAFKVQERDPRLLAERLAHAKAVSVAPDEPAAVIIGGDQVVSCHGRTFGKPGSAGAAIAQLAALAGHAHELITAVVVIRGERVLRHTDVTTLWMRALSPEAIERYVVADRPFDCAGGYKLESRGIALFERIDSQDHTAITGIPLIALVTMLRSLGYEIP
jgi:septum formation protein